MDKLKVGQIFSLGDPKPGFADLHKLVKGESSTGYGYRAPGIFSPAAPSIVYRGSTHDFIPFFVLDSNPFKHGTDDTPWSDEIDPEQQFAIYYGDTKTGDDPMSTVGNRKIIKVLKQYFDPALRVLAPPMMVMRRVEVNGAKKGFRRLEGIGYPESVTIEMEREVRSNSATSEYFINLAFRIRFVTKYGDVVNPEWLVDRRNTALKPEEMLINGMDAWKSWAK